MKTLKIADRADIARAASLAAAAAATSLKGKVGKTARETVAPKGYAEAVRLLANGRVTAAAEYLTLMHGVDMRTCKTLESFVAYADVLVAMTTISPKLKTADKRRAALEAYRAEHAAMVADATAQRRANETARAAAKEQAKQTA